MKTTNARCWRNSGRSERQQGRSVRKDEAEPELIPYTLRVFVGLPATRDFAPTTHDFVPTTHDY